MNADRLLIAALPRNSDLVGFSLYYERSDPELVQPLGTVPKTVAADGSAGMPLARLRAAACRIDPSPANGEIEENTVSEPG